MKKLILSVMAVIALSLLGVWYFSPNQVIMRRTKHLMEVVSFSKDAGRTMRQAKVYSMNRLLANDVELAIQDLSDANGTFEKHELESAFSWICQNAMVSDFRVTEFVNIKHTEDLAIVHFYGEGFMEISGTRPADGCFDVILNWRKTSDGWRFEKVVWKKR